MMKLIVPAAGIGTRLRPHTLALPKTLIPIAGKPVIDRLLEPLLPFLSEMIFIVGERSGLLQQHICQSYYKPVHFVHQEKQEGLGHAISQAGPYVDDEPILIVLDDGIFELDPERVINSPDSLIGVRAVDTLTTQVLSVLSK